MALLNTSSIHECIPELPAFWRKILAFNIVSCEAELIRQNEVKIITTFWLCSISTHF